MTIPDYETIMLPLLKLAGDKKEHSMREATDFISKMYQLTEEEKKQLLPSGKQFLIDNRVGWARTHLKKAGLVDITRWGYFIITEAGLDVIKKNPPVINRKFLEQFPSFIEFIKIKRSGEQIRGQDVRNNSNLTPQEQLDYGYQTLRRELVQDVSTKVRDCSPYFFEQLVVDLLLKMGYGGSIKDAGKAIGRIGDGGIDGIIKEDKLGLDVIYIQAKHWNGAVGSKEIRNFVGSLVGQKANKGVFITTSSFTKDALDYIKTIQHKVILIDGEMLAELLIDNNLGVSTTINYEIKKVDNDYFIEE